MTEIFCKYVFELNFLTFDCYWLEHLQLLSIQYDFLDSLAVVVERKQIAHKTEAFAWSIYYKGTIWGMFHKVNHSNSLQRTHPLSNKDILPKLVSIPVVFSITFIKFT